MFQTLRARLIGMSIAVATLSLLGLSLVVYVVVRANMLQALDERVGGLTRQYAAELTQWIGDKQQLTSSIEVAVREDNPLPFLQAAEKAGLDLAYFVMADKRHPEYPDAPTLKEVGINGFDFSTWFSLAGPPGLPKEIVTRLRNEAVKALADPEIKERYAALGLSANGNTPEELVGVVKEQLARYGKAIRDNHIKAE